MLSLSSRAIDHDHDPDEILARLPERYRDRFLAEYRAAMVAAAQLILQPYSTIFSPAGEGSVGPGRTRR
ncbi:DUF6247 family protein [Streptosporangium canum]|uniref:DUF6247 family protein n=1 Tax=Streptosporangium canum TaxID=324952 RepID=UPI00368120E5